MNSDLMTQYIKFVADRLVVQLGYKKIYNVTKFMQKTLWKNEKWIFFKFYSITVIKFM